MQRNGEHLPTQLSVLDLATLSLFVADDAFQSGDSDLGNSALLSARSLIDFATDFVPGVSMAKDVVTLVSGTNPITGEAVSDVARAILLGGLLLPSAIAGAGKGAARLSRALLRMENRLPATAAFANSLRGVVSGSDNALKKLASDSLGCAIP